MWTAFTVVPWNAGGAPTRTQPRAGREARLAADPYWFRTNRFILQCAWPHHSVATLSVVLRFLARLLAAYRLSTPVDSVSGHRPIWAVPVA